jgi:hypothetical protein
MAGLWGWMFMGMMVGRGRTSVIRIVIMVVICGFGCFDGDVGYRD